MEGGLVPSARLPPSRSVPRSVRRAWTSEASVYRDVSWEASATALSASASATTNRIGGGAQRSRKGGHGAKSRQPSQLQDQRRRQRPLSASYATSNRAAGVQRRQQLRRPQSAGPARSGAAAPAVARPQSAGPMRQDAAADSSEEDENAVETHEFSGLGQSPIRTRSARARRPNSANASIRWLQPLASAGSSVRPASAAGRMQGGSRRVWDGYNIYCPRPDPIESDDGEEEALVQEQLRIQARNESAIAIQCAYRIHLALRTVAQRRRRASEDRAACKLQAQSRGWLMRRHRGIEVRAAR